MKDTNDYNMMSGAFIFDALDRAALDYVRKESGLNTTIVTKHAQIDFLRQLCDDNYRVECSEYQQVFKSFSALKTKAVKTSLFILSEQYSIG